MLRSILAACLGLMMTACASTSDAAEAQVVTTEQNSLQQAVNALAAADSPEQVSSALRKLTLAISSGMAEEFKDTSSLSDDQFNNWLDRQLDLIRLQDARRELTRRDLEFLTNQLPKLLVQLHRHPATVDELAGEREDSKWRGLLPSEPQVATTDPHPGGEDSER